MLNINTTYLLNDEFVIFLSSLFTCFHQGMFLMTSVDIEIWDYVSQDTLSINSCLSLHTNILLTTSLGPATSSGLAKPPE